MKICALSDTHGYDFTIPECDVFCHCGDWSPLEIHDDFVSMASWMETFITHLCNLPCRHVVIISGNHDLIMDSLMGKGMFEDIQYRLCLCTSFIGENGVPKTEKKVHYLNRTSVELDGVRFWGSPVTKQIDRYRKHWAFETNTPEYDIPEYTDVILTHHPSDYKGLGNTHWHMPEPSKRLGVKSLTDAVLKTKAKMHLCGHIHTGNHSPVVYMNEAQTIGCNVSMLDENYVVAYDPFQFVLKV